MKKHLLKIFLVIAVVGCWKFFLPIKQNDPAIIAEANLQVIPKTKFFSKESDLESQSYKSIYKPVSKATLVTPEPSEEMVKNLNHDHENDATNRENAVDNEQYPNDIETEMEKFQAVYETWKQEREDFYREELELNESEINWLNRLEERAGSEIENLVKLMEQEDTHPTEGISQKSIQRVLESYEDDVSKVIGAEKIAKLKQFRDTYNAEIDSRFGTNSRIVGF